jgi:hypothetical protein
MVNSVCELILFSWFILFYSFEDFSGGFTNSIVVDDNELNKIINFNNTEQSAPPPPPLYSNRSNGTKTNPEHDNPKWDADVARQTITGDYLLKEYFTNEKYLAYIKTITLNKIKNQALGNYSANICKIDIKGEDTLFP